MSRPSIILLLSLMPMLASVQAVLTAADAAYEKELGVLAEPFDYEAHLTRCWACAEAEGLTDARGEFGFSNLSDRQFQLSVSDARLAEPSREILIRPGQAERVTILIEIPEWSNLKAAQP